jgi:predicted membrane protein (TIGR00267 family)
MPAIRHITRGLIDGSLSTLGTVIGASISGDPRVMIAAGLGGGMANAISNVLGAFTAERADVMVQLSKYEKALVGSDVDLKKTKIYEKKKRKAQKNGLIDGASTFVGSIIPMAPFAFLGIRDGIFTATIITTVLLFCLGVYLGKLSRENLMVAGSKMALFGIAAALLASSLEFFFR